MGESGILRYRDVSCSLEGRRWYNALHSAGQGWGWCAQKPRYLGAWLSREGIGWTPLCAAWFAIEIHGSEPTACACGSGNQHSYFSYHNRAL